MALAHDAAPTAYNLVTLIIAVCALVIGAAGLGWQIAAHVLAGGRVKLEHIHGLANDQDRDMWRFEEGTLDGEAQQRLRARGYTSEISGVTVRNPGRHAVTVSGIRMIIAPTGVTYLPLHEAYGPALPHRLEAGASAHWAIRTSLIRTAAAATLKDGRSGESFVFAIELGDGRTKSTRPHPIPAAAP